MSNGDPQIEQFAGTYTPPTFPTWPPPSGGAPVTNWELGPITNPYPYGTSQPANISMASGLQPSHPYASTFFPQKMPTGANGQNQAAPANWPTWPRAKITTLPDKADPATSRIP